MKKIKLIKNNELAISKGKALYCDFCGEDNVICLTSTFDNRKDQDERKCEFQICLDCIKQLSKIV